MQIFENMYKPWCHCRQITHGDMIACDGEDFEIEWFHSPFTQIKANSIAGTAEKRFLYIFF